MLGGYYPLVIYANPFFKITLSLRKVIPELGFVFFGNSKMNPADILSVSDIEGCFDKMLLQGGSGFIRVDMKLQ
jgi:hypothetical protein